MPFNGRGVKRIVRYIRAWSFHKLTGSRKTTRDQFLARVKTCNRCQYIVHRDSTEYDECGLCDCLIVPKAAMLEQVCPNVDANGKPQPLWPKLN